MTRSVSEIEVYHSFIEQKSAAFYHLKCYRGGLVDPEEPISIDERRKYLHKTPRNARRNDLLNPVFPLSGGRLTPWFPANHSIGAAMTHETLYNVMLWISFPLALTTFVLLRFVTAPYGRYKRKGWGPLVSNRLGWFLMEAPSAMVFAYFFSIGNVPKTSPLLLFFFLWELHYIHRAFVYPFQIADTKRNMPLTILIMGLIFNLGNAYLNGSYLFLLSDGYPVSWFTKPQMILGIAFFTTGFLINRWADKTLRALRKENHDEYQIPHGGLYHWVSCPNYLGEILEWGGWAIATWSLAGLSFAVWTFANLAPRAYAHHRWYRQYFPEYPSERKALLPGIW